MARLTFDATLILAKVCAGEDTLLVNIAFDVFNGYDPSNPTQPTKSAMLRATRAAQSLVAMKRATPIPSRKVMQGIRIADPSGGAVQAQYLMSLVVRGGVDRRKGDRRTEERPDGHDQRVADRRVTPQMHPRPLRVERKPPPKIAKPPSPFDIKFRLKGNQKP